LPKDDGAIRRTSMLDFATTTRAAAARNFVRSLNILLKFARMYDFGHPRTAKQYETAWSELKTALGADDDAGLLLAVSGDNLLLDGTPLESAAAEKSFARMLSAAGIASIHFSSKTTQQSLARFVRGFPTGTGSKPMQLAEQLKGALHGDPHIHVNEVCFVPADSAVAKTTVAATLAAKTLGMSSEQTDELLNDPEKLLQLLVAADGARSGRGSGEGAGEKSSSIRSDGSELVSGPSGAAEPTARWRESLGSGTRRGRAGVNEGARVEGPVAQIHGEGGSINAWNIVGRTGNGGGTPIDPNVGGFWFSKEGSGPVVEGAVPVAEEGPAGSGTSGGWNIVGGTGQGKPISPNVGGFWFTKEGTGFSEVSVTPVGAASGPAAAGSDSFSGNPTVAARVDASGPRFRGGAAPPVDRPARWANASAAIRTARTARGGSGSMTVETGLMTLQEDELQGIMQVLGQIARTSEASKGNLDPRVFQSRLSTLPRRARFTVSQALAALAAQAPTGASDKPTLLKLAEHIAIRFALESYERGDVEVNNVRQLLGDMSTELNGLRKILGVYEEKMQQAGIEAGSPVEILAQEFWGQISEEKKKEVIESPRAWCVPPVRLREYIVSLSERSDSNSTEMVLTNYANCLRSEETEARRQTALGLAELAELYGKCGEKLLGETIRLVGTQLAGEQDGELQSLLSAAFVRLSQEAAKIRSYAGLQDTVELLNQIETERPGASKSLRPKINIESKLPEFIEEALRTGSVPNGLSELLSRLAQPAAEQIAVKFGRVGFREDCELLISMMDCVGPEGLDHLRNHLEHGTPSEAIETIGILARMDLDRLERVLPDRMREWKRSAHDRIVRQLASSGAPERGRLLLQLFDGFDPLIRSLAIDEIGMSGEKTAGMRLLRIAEGDLPRGSGDYLRLKAIEALGRLRTTGAEAILRKVAEARKAFRWANPSELRVVAAQALEKIDPEWMRDFVPRSGLNIAEFSIELLDSDPNSSAIRQRRYPRLRLEHPVHATTTNLKDNCEVAISEMGLGGGVARCEQRLHPGNVVELRLHASQKSIRAQTIVRDANTQARAFEVVDMSVEERAKLRKLLVQLGNVQRQSTPNERNRYGGRTILVTG
jgi:hypothetical protein